MRFLAFLLICSFPLAFSAESDIGTDSVATREINGTAAESNATNAKPKEDSFADMIDRALEKEFPENDQNDGSSTSRSFRSSTFRCGARVLFSEISLILFSTQFQFLSDLVLVKIDPL